MKISMIILSIIFSGSLFAKESVCPYPEIVNIKLSVQLEKRLFESAAKRCKIKMPDLPCLTKFEKINVDDYIAICGSFLPEKIKAISPPLKPF